MSLPALSLLVLTLLLPAPLLAAPCPPPAAPPAAWFGPPLLCHPIAIGDAPSLPWKGEAFGRDTSYDVARTVDDTLALLEGSSAAFVHMETLRRAVIYLGGGGGSDAVAGAAARDEAWRHAEARRLVAALQARTAVIEPGALRWFDLGYARAALDQMNLPFEASAPPKAAPAEPVMSRAELVRGPLGKAAALAPQDGALQLGVAIALFDGVGRDEDACLAHLDRSLALADDPGGLLRTNLLGTMGRFLGARTHEDLVAAVRERRQRG